MAPKVAKIIQLEIINTACNFVYFDLESFFSFEIRLKFIKFELENLFFL